MHKQVSIPKAHRASLTQWPYHTERTTPASWVTSNRSSALLYQHALVRNEITAFQVHLTTYRYNASKTKYLSQWQQWVISQDHEWTGKLRIRRLHLMSLWSKWICSIEEIEGRYEMIQRFLWVIKYIEGLSQWDLFQYPAMARRQ